MSNLYAGIGVGAILMMPLMGLAFLMHGFNFITINKYYAKEDKKDGDQDE